MYGSLRISAVFCETRWRNQSASVRLNILSIKGKERNIAVVVLVDVVESSE